jgi:hypothetical protein
MPLVRSHYKEEDVRIAQKTATFTLQTGASACNYAKGLSVIMSQAAIERATVDSLELYGFKLSAQSGQKLDSQSGPSRPGTSYRAVGRIPQREAGPVHDTPPDSGHGVSKASL